MRPDGTEHGADPARRSDRPVAARPVAVALRVADPELRARLARLLDAAPELELVAAETTARRADALLTDRPPAAGGGGAAQTPSALVLAADSAAREAALRAGARGVLPPDAEDEQLVAATIAVARGLVVRPAEVRGEAPFPPSVPLAIPDTAASTAEPIPALTPREREVLALLAAGAANKVIARRLGVSFHTAKAHVASVLAKLGASSRADAVARGIRAGLVLL